MAKLIYLSPSDQTANKYAYGNTNEAVQCRKISDACAKALKAAGFTVINNKTDSMYDRVAESNKKKAALHVCIHTNASNGTVAGTRIFSYDTTGEGRKAAKAVYDVLAPLTPGKSDNISTNKTWYEMINSTAPCVYCECEFHDNKEAAEWIVGHTAEIGEAIAEGICNYFGVKKPADKPAEKPAEKPDAAVTVVKLSDEPLYSTATSKTPANHVTGTYYYWDDETVSGRRRITNRKDRIGVAGQVTGWINARGSEPAKPATYKKGQAVELEKAALYASSTTNIVANRVSGTYYLWDGKKLNGRFRITNLKSRVGVAGQVTGWVDAGDL